MAAHKRLLVFTGFYLPGYKAGGPLKTLRNMVVNLDDEFSFLIVTRDRDLRDTEPYFDVALNAWNHLEHEEVFYVSPDSMTLSLFSKIINETDFDVLYLNSFFDFNYTTKVLLARRFCLIKPCPVVLAPRGEFSKGALSLKSFKKRIFIKVSEWLGLYKDIVWQASSELEKKDILNSLVVDQNSVFISMDLPARKNKSSILPNFNPSDDFKLVFLSRISPMKNLDFALCVLASVKAPLCFEIYGPIEDDVYWEGCLKLIEELPEHVVVKYCGSVMPDNVSEVFSQYDLFFFPTRGENYGHVIAESLSVGTPVLISDQTPWQCLSDDGLGWDLRLDDESVFVEKIEQVASMTVDERLVWREQVMVGASSKVNCDSDVADNKALFEFAIKRFDYL